MSENNATMSAGMPASAPAFGSDVKRLPLKDLLKRMQKLAAEHGMSLNEVIGQEADKAPAAAPAAKKAAAAKPAKKAKAASVIKFRHPENASIGWTGHGRKPQWVIDWVAQGKSLDDLRADAAAVTAA